MFSTGPNNPRQVILPPSSRARRPQGLRQSPPPIAGSSSNPLGASVGGGLFGTGRNTTGNPQQRDREPAQREQQRMQDQGTVMELSDEQKAEINEAVGAPMRGSPRF